MKEIEQLSTICANLVTIHNYWRDVPGKYVRKEQLDMMFTIREFHERLMKLIKEEEKSDRWVTTPGGHLK